MKRKRGRDNLVVLNPIFASFLAFLEEMSESSRWERKDRSNICGDFTARRFMATSRKKR